MSKKQFSIRLNEDLYEMLDDYRWENRQSLNEVVNKAVKEFLDRNAIERESAV